MKNSKKEELSQQEALRNVLIQAVYDCTAYAERSKNRENPGFKPSVFEDTDRPLGEMSLHDVYLRAKKSLLDHPQFLNQHAGFMGWVVGAGRDINMLSELMSAALNSSVQTESQTSARIELELARWMKQIFEWPLSGQAYTVSGTSQGNLISLLAARHRLHPQSKQEGLPQNEKLIVIGSDHTHLSVIRAMQMMGLGENQFRSLATEKDGKLSASRVEKTILQLKPHERVLCVVATLGSTIAGAFDDLASLRAVCDRYGIWLHVDGAWGAWTKLDQSRTELTEHINSADSLAFDFHKWPGSTMGTGMVLFKPQTDLKSLFQVESPYLDSLSNAAWQFSEMGPEVTRPQRALATWMLLQHYGVKKLGEQIKENFDLAHQLNQRLQSHPGLDLPFESCLNTIVFRFRIESDDRRKSDQRVLQTAQEFWKDGRFMPSLINWKSAVYLRFCLMNPAVSSNDIDELCRLIFHYADQESI